MIMPRRNDPLLMPVNPLFIWTTLAFAFLLVLLGAIITRSSHDGATNAAEQAAANEPSEPLAELGVAPGASDDTTNNSNANKQ